MDFESTQSAWDIESELYVKIGKKKEWVYDGLDKKRRAKWKPHHEYPNATKAERGRRHYCCAEMCVTLIVAQGRINAWCFKRSSGGGQSIDCDMLRLIRNLRKNTGETERHLVAKRIIYKHLDGNSGKEIYKVQDVFCEREITVDGKTIIPDIHVIHRKDANWDYPDETFIEIVNSSAPHKNSNAWDYYKNRQNKLVVIDVKDHQRGWSFDFEFLPQLLLNKLNRYFFKRDNAPLIWDDVRKNIVEREQKNTEEEAKILREQKMEVAILEKDRKERNERKQRERKERDRKERDRKEKGERESLATIIQDKIHRMSQFGIDRSVIIPKLYPDEEFFRLENRINGLSLDELVEFDKKMSYFYEGLDELENDLSSQIDIIKQMASKEVDFDLMPFNRIFGHDEFGFRGKINDYLTDTEIDSLFALSTKAGEWLGSYISFSFKHPMQPELEPYFVEMIHDKQRGNQYSAPISVDLRKCRTLFFSAHVPKRSVEHWKTRIPEMFQEHLVSHFTPTTCLEIYCQDGDLKSIDGMIRYFFGAVLGTDAGSMRMISGRFFSEELLASVAEKIVPNSNFEDALREARTAGVKYTKCPSGKWKPTQREIKLEETWEKKISRVRDLFRNHSF
uniref:Uncharacterized protein n=1 Tax=uncultured marine group II/III euryarchaeote KM3_92_B07 TaxID=1456543 RepID=A0A075I1I9_9EURY|nr:hypothetical protein [uncultured marine group II/III euryarchaeote KM3_92_B07]